MPILDGYDYDAYQVFITLPKEIELHRVIEAGCTALGINFESTATEINWEDSYKY